MKADANRYYSGTSGLNLPVPNKSFYPPAFQDKSRLCYYSSLFNSIEVNSSFYKLPFAATVQKWVESVSPGFRFTFKLWKEITHAKALAFNDDDVIRFLQAVQPAAGKNACLLLQFPPGLKNENTPQLERLLTVLAEHNSEPKWNLALEFRDSSWYNETCFGLIKKYGASVVMHDKPASAWFEQEPEADFVYLRFHGINGDYKGSYPDDFLGEFSEYIRSWREQGKTIFVYFNNTRGDAVQNLIKLNRLVL